MLTFRLVSVGEIFSLNGFDELTAEYMEESGNPFLPKNPDFDYYRTLEEKARLFVIGIFDGDRLVGFGSFVLTELPHHSIITAAADTIFLSKAYRRGSAGLRLLRNLSELAKSKGASGIYWGCRSGSRLEKVFEKLERFKRMNTVFYEALA